MAFFQEVLCPCAALGVVEDCVAKRREEEGIARVEVISDYLCIRGSLCDDARTWSRPEAQKLDIPTTVSCWIAISGSDSVCSNTLDIGIKHLPESFLSPLVLLDGKDHLRKRRIATVRTELAQGTLKAFGHQLRRMLPGATTPSSKN